MTVGPYAIGSDVWPGLSKLAEECGELLQVIGKIIGTSGEPAHWDGTDLRLRLMEEMADTAASISFVLGRNFTADEAVVVGSRAVTKEHTFMRWHEEQRSDSGS